MRVAALLAVAFPVANVAWAQSTDGYHNFQVFPVVVDSGSFKQRFSITNPNGAAGDGNPRTLSIATTYYGGEGTAAAGSLDCPGFQVAAGELKAFASLRDVCPDLPAGTAFGFLVMREVSTGNTGARPFAGYSRVSNIAGAGFSVEAFPAHAFTATTAVVAGLRRLASTPSSPTYQTNCFVGNMGEVTPSPVPEVTHVDVELYDSSDTKIGSGGVDLLPGQFVRLLDVFAFAGVPAGDRDDVRARFIEASGNEPGLLTMCTVQDNTSFGADFRIGKQEYGFGFLLGGQDNTRARDFRAGGDFRLSGDASPRKFTIPAASNTGNAHLFHFRHPDTIGCRLIVAATNADATPAYGLEMRLLSPLTGANWTTVAGGSGVVGFSDLYLGDKEEVGNGANAMYVLEVESNGQNMGAVKDYKLHCRSGSGHGIGELLRTGAPENF
jgi:hypothetical protein